MKILLLFALVALVSVISVNDAFATCGLQLNSTTINFGTIDKGSESIQKTLQLSNTGTQTGTVTVSTSNWKDSGGTIHIAGQHTRFATSDQGSNISYSSKTPLNSTNGNIAFGVVTTTQSNSTYWQFSAILTNLPFSSTLTQSITFTSTC